MRALSTAWLIAGTTQAVRECDLDADPDDLERLATWCSHSLRHTAELLARIEETQRQARPTHLKVVGQ